jgi:hypothetical protein
VCEHSTNLLTELPDGEESMTRDELKANREKQVRFQLEKGSFGYRQMVKIVAAMSSAVSFVNIGGHRYRCSLDLTHQAVFLTTRKIRGQPVDRFNQVHGLLPNDEISIRPQ